MGVISIVNGDYKPTYNYGGTTLWYTYPWEKYEFVSWDDEIPNIWKSKIHFPIQQPVNDTD